MTAVLTAPSNLNTRRQQIIESNRREYGEHYDTINWITPEVAAAAYEERGRLLRALEGRARFAWGGAKPHTGALSPGCQRCVAGSWSCLFTSGRCNCNCFFCPASQDQPDVPGTNNLTFARPGDYVDYLAKFGFTGVSVSGGEPLLQLDNSLKYLKRVRYAFGPAVHLWLYSNGTLVTSEALEKLRDAGLNEIRINIMASSAGMDAVRLAAQVIDVVTVEIPAIPELEELMKQRLIEMRDAGVKFLNLHQLRLTAHNLPRLCSRGYTFLHGDSGAVLGSELMALRLMHWTLENGIELPINYCSFVYRNRSSNVAARMRGAELVQKPHEDLTVAGYLRQLTVKGEAEEIAAQAAAFNSHPPHAGSWTMNHSKDSLHVGQSLWKHIDFSKFRTTVAYQESRVVDALSHRRFFVEVPLNDRRTIYVEKAPAAPPVDLSCEQAIAFASGRIPQHLLAFEVVEEGLADYRNI